MEYMDSEYKKIGRVLSLYDRLSSGKIIYLKDEINATGVSDRSFKRDITELRNYLAEKAADGESRKEIIYDRNRNCYYMTEEKEALPDYQEIFAIAKILLGSKGLSRVEMNQVVEYLLSLCNDESKRKEIKKCLANELINYQGPNHGKNLISMIWKLAQAVEHQNRLEIQYKRLEGQQDIKRVLEPVGVMFSEYYFYLLAYIKGIREEKSKKLNPMDMSHEIVTKKVLDEYPEGLILYVINAQQIGTYDDKSFLKVVAKKIRDNPQFSILFAINKMDLIDPAKEKPDELIANCRKYIESNGIENPRIIPVSAESALLFKKVLLGIELSEIEEENFLRNYRYFKREGFSLQDYISVPRRENLEEIITVDGNEYTRAQIFAALENTGLPFLEKQIDETLVRSLKMQGIECTWTESVYENIKKLDLPDLEAMVKKLYDDGFGRFVVKQIREYKTKNYDKLTEYQRQNLNRLTGKKQELEQSRCIVTTHAYFQMMKLDTLDSYEIIIDEDFLVTLFKRNWSLSLEDVKTIITKRILSPRNTEKLKQILDMKDQETQKIAFVKPNKYELEKLYERTNEVNGPLPLLLESSCVVMDRVHEEIMFCEKFELPPRKMIILSASVNEKLYEDVSGGGERVRFRNIPEVKYKGHVIQYTAHTMSRKCIKTAGPEKVLQKVKEIAGDVPVISFKMIDTDLDIHFGKTEGFDNLKGKDIAIVGTPHNRPALYKLLGEALGYNTAGNITNHRVERNNYEFRIMTFADKSMRNLQLFLIETELEQAIGRARVLREDCTVYVFSNYPCKQAELNMEPYLNITAEEESEDEEEIKE